MDACLKTDEVEALVAGDLPDEDKARFEAHIASCSRCRKVVGVFEQDRELEQDIQQAYEKITASDSNSTLFDHSPGKEPGIAKSIEGYEILHEIHRGGQGVVYKAVQMATKRTVALKVLLHGPYASANQQHRFEREIDLVASLQHPNIVTVYDSGVAHGHHYFAMQYIHGQSLGTYLSKTKLSIDETLRLFQKICSAVNSAHQRGVIHRDLKPGNIRVDAAGEPYVLDFGLAKAAGSDLQGGVPVTLSGEFMGTLAYASPEQTKGDPNLIDIRTDVYSLGVILFEMLTGKYPYPVVGRMADVLNNIVELEPKRPSTIRQQINDEVETIVLQALSKEKERRYQSAEALARDVGRYLNGEPIDAKRDSTWYVLRKSLRRYYLMAGVAAAFVLILGVSTIALSIMYQNQSRARQEAETARAAEEEQRTLAEERTQEATAAKEVAIRREAEAIAARAETQKRADELQIVTEFQQSMLGEINVEEMGRALYDDLRARIREALKTEGLSSVDSESLAAEFDQMLRRTNATDAALTLVDKQVLSQAVKAIESDFADQPMIRAALQQTVADTYSRIGRFPSAMPLQRSALQIRRAELGNDHPDTLTSVNDMGVLLKRMGKFEEAFDCYREALEGRRRVLGNDHPDTLGSVSNMGALLESQGKLAEAEPYYREALETKRRVLGDEHPDTLLSINNMGFLLHRQRKLVEAEPYYREGLEGLRRVLGNEHPHTLSSINNLGALLQSQGNLAEAEKYMHEVLEGLRRVLGDEHPNTLSAINNVGGVLKQLGRFTEAEPYFREALEGCRRVLGDEHPTTLSSISNMGALLESQGKFAEAESYYREALETRRRVLGDDHPRTLLTMAKLASFLVEVGRAVEGERLAREAVEGERRVRGEKHLGLGFSLGTHGFALTALERFEEAEETLLEAHDILVAAHGEEREQNTRVVGYLIDLYDAWHVDESDGGYDTKAATWRARLEDPAGKSAPRQESSSPEAPQP